MKLKRLFLMTAVLCGALMSASAQEQDTTLYEFRPHWYIHGGFGYQYTIGETKDALALSYMNAQIGVGYDFTPVWGLRLIVNGWESRAAYQPGEDMTDMAGNQVEGQNWKWYYVAPALDVTMDLTNLIGGYKHDRIVNVGLILGGGANIFFKNDEAATAKDNLNAYDFGSVKLGDEILQYYWEGCKASPLGRAGLYIDFRITDKFRLGLEGTGNIVMDKYNSRYAHNPDWYLNALVTAKYNFGGTYNEKKVDKSDLYPCPPVPVPVHDTVYVENEIDTLAIVSAAKNTGNGTALLAMKDSLRTEIFFPISSDKVSVTEAVKLRHILDFMNKYPESKVLVTGHADKQTGTAKFNQMISEKRAQVVKEYLLSQGIAEDRITVKAMGDTDNPYSEKGDDPVLNRVSICVIE